jgi:hypothetical protein
MKRFELTLKQEKQRSFIWFSWLIIIGNLALFIYLSALSGFKNIGPLLYVVLAIIAIIVVYYSKEQREKPRLYVLFLIIILGWINSRTYWWVAIPILIFMILDGIARRELIVKVFADKIIYPSWPPSEIKWQELNNVIIKDRVLTIDFKSDKLIQQLIDEKNTQIDEKEFNAFCQQQLNK